MLLRGSYYLQVNILFTFLNFPFTEIYIFTLVQRVISRQPAAIMQQSRNFGVQNYERKLTSPPTHATPTAAKEDDVVIPDIVNSLEWTLESPISVHQFDEPPVIFIFL